MQQRPAVTGCLADASRRLLVELPLNPFRQEDLDERLVGHVALVREQLSAVRDQIAGLQLLEGELEQVLRRPLTPARERLAKGCQCLEVEGTRRRQEQRTAP